MTTLPNELSDAVSDLQDVDRLAFDGWLNGRSDLWCAGEEIQREVYATSLVLKRTLDAPG